jgi:GT2 family glycosyltransferase
MLYKQYDALRTGRFEANARQFYTGNASMARELFNDVGGFDASYRRAEDIEMAYRLNEHGVTFVFDEQAAGYHHASRTFDSWLAAAYAYGRNDVRFAATHDQPWMLDALCYDYCSRNILLRGFARLSLRLPFSTAPLQGALRLLALGLWRLRLQTSARYALSGLYGLGFYNGAAEELGGPHKLLEMIATYRQRNTA